MAYLLDTNTCIYFLNKSSQNIISKMKKLSPSEIRLSSITVAELFFGAEKSKAKKKNRTTVEKFVSNFEVKKIAQQQLSCYAIFNFMLLLVLLLAYQLPTAFAFSVSHLLPAQ